MSDPEGPKPHEQPDDVAGVVDSANAGLADAVAARGEATPSLDAPEPLVAPAVDPDLAAFEEAELSHPGTFSSSSAASSSPAGSAAEPQAGSPEPVIVRDTETETETTTPPPFGADFLRETDAVVAAPAIADAAYEPPAEAPETRVMPSEPASVAPAPQPIFVQAPEPPRELGNRGAIAGIGLLAAIAFAALYFAVALGLRALAGEVTLNNIGSESLAMLPTWGLWVPVVVFYLGFCLLGAVINRGRWGLWVIFGILVGLAAYAGHLLGQVIEAPFWGVSARQGAELVARELFAPLAIAAFVFGRELTIWFGAWVSRLGARKTEANAEAQREYERTLEAGPTLAR